MDNKPKRKYERSETPIDRFVRLYVEMPVAERTLAMAALRGADLALGKGARSNGMDNPAQAAFEELGSRIAEDHDGQ